jgi:hypothetical protein
MHHPSEEYPGSQINSSAAGEEFDLISANSLTIGVDRPVEVPLEANVGVALAKDLSSRFAYRIVARAGKYGPPIPEAENLDLRFEDVYPSLSTAGHARVLLFAEAVVGWLVDNAKMELRKVLRQAGYESFPT